MLREGKRTHTPVRLVLLKYHMNDVESFWGDLLGNDADAYNNTTWRLLL